MTPYFICKQIIKYTNKVFTFESFCDIIYT